MIILGDIACPSPFYSNKLSNLFKEHSKIFNYQYLIFNLEGLIFDRYEIRSSKSVIFNHSSVVNILKEQFIPIASLANNHTLDLPEAFTGTRDIFKNNNLRYLGSGFDEAAADDTVTVWESGFEIIILNACWDFLLHYQRNPNKGVFVNKIHDIKILGKIEYLRKMHPNAKIVIYLHWGFDLENVPLPRDRILAKAMIDCGADLIVGSHSHCIQGGEKYKNGHIIYGIGNFFFPNGVYMGGNLTFPSWSSEALAIEWDIKRNHIYNHWFKIIGRGEGFHLDYLETNSFEVCARLKSYSKYVGLSDGEYIKYYKTHRRKSKMIPVLKYIGNKRENFYKLNFIKFRAKIARLLAVVKLREWQN